LSIVLRDRFDDLLINFYTEKGELLVPSNDLDRGVGYASPKESESKLFNRHKSELAHLTRVVKLTTPRGGAQLTRCYTEEGVLKFCMFARTEKAAIFREWAVKKLKTCRKNFLDYASVELAQLHTVTDKLTQGYDFISSEMNHFRNDITTLALEVKRLQNIEDQKLNRCITTEQKYVMRKEVWKLADRISILKGEGPANAEYKKAVWERLKKDLKIDIYFKYELFSVRQFEAAINWLEEKNKDLNLKLEGLV